MSCCIDYLTSLIFLVMTLCNFIYMNYVLVPVDKVANNVVVVWRFYYINTLNREFVDTNAYKNGAFFE